MLTGAITSHVIPILKVLVIPDELQYDRMKMSVEDCCHTPLLITLLTGTTNTPGVQRDRKIALSAPICNCCH